MNKIRLKEKISRLPWYVKTRRKVLKVNKILQLKLSSTFLPDFEVLNFALNLSVVDLFSKILTCLENN